MSLWKLNDYDFQVETFVKLSMNGRVLYVHGPTATAWSITLPKCKKQSVTVLGGKLLAHKFLSCYSMIIIIF